MVCDLVLADYFFVGCWHFVGGLFVLFLVLVAFGFLCLAMDLRFGSLGCFVCLSCSLLVLLLFDFLISWSG